MNFNLFPVIAASAISASVVLPAHAQVEVRGKSSVTQSYTEKYLQQSAHFHAALGGKHAH
ncbi:MULTISPECIES: hypothetical protein [Pseudomonas]|uniref:DUF4148 domain-containing protein n=2 Tax=Pseudomonas TaxID=286 RepID=A0AAX0VVH1_9PSED|nr:MULTISPECIES: hypothetical protein [Pseudomonas]MBF8731982.1 hypothetical protein [Pseudomonas guariconensis]MBH3358913.1 hypothetical protein [Pseudomonas guariconensis]MCO7624089.1 hypothetical protein [Pseudomonas guariconensis]MDD2091042.1 hypothetical protein [Pseudomonas guariconensis]MDM9595098.1 hypothetical protein [Pseudomonas guariconensis]